MVITVFVILGVMEIFCFITAGYALYDQDKSFAVIFIGAFFILTVAIVFQSIVLVDNMEMRDKITTCELSE